MRARIARKGQQKTQRPALRFTSLPRAWICNPRWIENPRAQAGN